MYFIVSFDLVKSLAYYQYSGSLSKTLQNEANQWFVRNPSGGTLLFKVANSERFCPKNDYVIRIFSVFSILNIGKTKLHHSTFHIT